MEPIIEDFLGKRREVQEILEDMLMLHVAIHHFGDDCNAKKFNNFVEILFGDNNFIIRLAAFFLCLLKF